MASQGQPSRRVSIGPLVIHFLQPMHKSGSTNTLLNIGASGFSYSYIHRSTGHSVMQIGAPLHPVQASLIIASIFGFLFLCTLRFCFSATAIKSPDLSHFFKYFIRFIMDVYQIPRAPAKEILYAEEIPTRVPIRIFIYTKHGGVLRCIGANFGRINPRKFSGFPIQPSRGISGQAKRCLSNRFRPFINIFQQTAKVALITHVF